MAAWSFRSVGCCELEAVAHDVRLYLELIDEAAEHATSIAS